MEPECNFWGVRIPAGESVDVAPEYKEDFITSVHLTQVALGDKARLGGHTIFIEKEGQKFALGTLDKEKCTHFSLDIHLATDSIKLSHTGKSDVYLTGYQAVSVAGDDDEGFPLGRNIGSDDEEMGSEDSEEEEESSDEEAPKAMPIANGKGGRTVVIDDEAEEGSSDEEDEEGDESDDEEDGLLESEENDSDEGGSDDDEDEDEEGDDDEEEESSEEEKAQPAPKGNKRAAQTAVAPQAPKHPKQEAAGQRVAPAPTPPKVVGQPAGSGDYLAALKSYLAVKGPTKMASLGGAVKRPPKVPKLKHFLEQHKATFKYDQGTDTVSLAA